MTFAMEFMKALGRIFINPTFYWILFIMIIPSYERLKNERSSFQKEVSPFMAEVRDTWPVALLAGIIVSLFTAGVGITFTYEVIIILSIVIFLLSISFQYTFLSVSYTLGFTYIVLKFLALKQPTNPLFIPVMFTSLALLIGLLLLFEAMLYFRIKVADTFPELVSSKRGRWLGLHHLKKITIIPLVVPIPKGAIAPIDQFWPYLSVGEDSYSLFLIPLVIGFHHIIQAELPFKAAQKLGTFTLSLAILTIIFALNSFLFPGLSVVSVIIAIIGKLYIHYKHSQRDQAQHPYFIERSQFLRVLGVIKGSPADQLGIQVGETITKINEKPVQTVADFDQVIQANERIHVIKVIDHKQRVRHIQNDTFQGDRLALGFLFTTKPADEQDPKST